MEVCDEGSGKRRSSNSKLSKAVIKVPHMDRIIDRGLVVATKPSVVPADCINVVCGMMSNVENGRKRRAWLNGNGEREGEDGLLP
jgi:hypothetical protein